MWSWKPGVKFCFWIVTGPHRTANINGIIDKVPDGVPNVGTEIDEGVWTASVRIVFGGANCGWLGINGHSAYK